MCLLLCTWFALEGVEFLWRFCLLCSTPMHAALVRVLVRVGMSGSLVLKPCSVCTNWLPLSCDDVCYLYMYMAFHADGPRLLAASFHLVIHACAAEASALCEHGRC